ncbi:fumarylacetoacetate hydrolase family protein [Metallosphaera tengchongensis]|uniref:Fumarylacetoacetate hydrolase family protein n=1 Tax=Metallosphaera tengchongensis TaxID=1532350 RepID=A0A6N0NRM9_9CREN|nr:fumarylacetoacetate hydrolase family protein [Metallosphaera tengchongensis]QKQ99415.1 fumarylacetoacetate hydrolase family protein [Metallosphaera tengchongensis]
MKLVSFKVGEQVKFGVLEGGEIEVTEGFNGRRTGETLKLSDVSLTFPIYPTAIFCTLVNSPRMLGVESKEEARNMLGSPKFFIKLPQTVIGYRDTILAPRSGVRPEVEIGIVVKRPIKNASTQEVRDSILGYVAFNDVTAPGEMKEDMYYAYRRDPADGKVKRMAVRGSHFRNKNRDTFSPMGPFVVTTDEMSDISGLEMRSTYGNAVVQMGNSDELVYGAEELLRELSKVLTVPKFSLVTTGTIGYSNAEEASEYKLEAKEAVLSVEVEGLGRLENPVKVAER